MITPITTYPNSGTDNETEFIENVNSYVPALKNSGDEITILDEAIETSKDNANSHHDSVFSAGIEVNDSLIDIDKTVTSQKASDIKNGSVGSGAVELFAIDDPRLKTESFLSLIPSEGMHFTLISIPTVNDNDITVYVKNKSGSTLLSSNSTSSTVFISLSLADVIDIPVDIFISNGTDNTLHCIYWIGRVRPFPETITPPA